jgi:hypothetical protein
MGRVKLIVVLFISFCCVISCECSIEDIEKRRYLSDQAIIASEISLVKFKNDLLLRQQDVVQTEESSRFNLHLNTIFESHYKLNLYLVKLIEDNYVFDKFNFSELNVRLLEFENTIDSLHEGDREHLHYHLRKLNFSFVKHKFKSKLDRETFLTEKLLSVHLVTLKSILIMHGKGPRLIREIQKDKIRKENS